MVVRFIKLVKNTTLKHEVFKTVRETLLSGEPRSLGSLPLFNGFLVGIHKYPF